MAENSRFIRAVALSLFGLFWFASYFFLSDLWAEIDEMVFFVFNDRLVPDSVFLKIVAYSNKRIFDVVAFACMGAVYFYYFRQVDNAGKRKLICLGLSMLLIAVVIKQCGNLLPVSHKSPTLYYENVNRLTKLTDIVTKDASRNSFPGDHGMMLMIFAAYMARYFGRRAFFAAAVIVVIFAMPRIASGAHWFSDIYMGSLAIVCMILGWILLTPVSDKLAAFFERFLPDWLFPKKGPSQTET
ncbi:MAG: Lipid A 1-diphosphate synthase [Desulfovibrio sp.]